MIFSQEFNVGLAWTEARDCLQAQGPWISAHGRRSRGTRDIFQLIRFILLLTSFSIDPAQALTRHELQEAGFHIVAGTPLPGKTILHGLSKDMPLAAALDGKPALLFFTDYRCRSLCGLMLDRLAQVLPHVGLRLGLDFNVISVALDPRQTKTDATTFRDQHTLGSALHDGGLFFTNDRSALDAIQAATGMVAPFDEAHEQFAHPAAFVLIDAQGRVRRALSPLSIDPINLRLALLDGGAAPQSFASHALLLCYGWDPASGVYTIQIERTLMVAAAITAFALLLAITGLLYKEFHPRKI